jgi:hypothetical protein
MQAEVCHGILPQWQEAAWALKRLHYSKHGFLDDALSSEVGPYHVICHDLSCERTETAYNDVFSVRCKSRLSALSSSCSLIVEGVYLLC